MNCALKINNINNFNLLKLTKKLLSKNLYTVSLYLRKLASAFTVFFLARYLSVSEYGLYSSYVNITAMILLFTNFGFNEYLLVTSNGDKEKVQFNINGFSILSMLIYTAIITISFLFNMQNKYLLILIMTKVFLENQFSIILLTYFQAMRKFNQISIINIIYSSSLMLVALFAYMNKLSLNLFLLANCIIVSVNVAVQFILMKINPLFYLNKFFDFLKSIDKNLVYYGMVMISVAVYMQIPSLFVSFSMPKKLAAIYFAAFNISSVLLLISVAQVQKILPELINSDNLTSRKILKKNILVISLINILLVIFFILFGKPLLLAIYSNTAYLKSYLILIIFALSNFFQAISSIMATLITAKGHQKKKFIFHIEFILVGLLASFLLINKFNIYGASFAYLFIYIYVIFRYYGYIKKQKLVSVDNAERHL